MADNALFPSGFIPYEELSDKESVGPILVAFSGGADSRALFELTARYCREKGTFFYACHVNHGIRGEEAIRDRDFCVNVANGCPECKEIFVLNADVPSSAAQSGRSLELEARLIRYGFFSKIMKKYGIPLLATAHNADDNLETLLFNLTRGSGAKGMCGIPRTREFEGGLIVRPILDMTKSEILDFCNEGRLEFVTDSTNSDTDYSRNLIRAEVIPLLEKINPGIRGAAMRLSDSMKELCSFAEDKAEGYSLAASSVASAPAALLPMIFGRAIKDAGSDAMLEAVHISALRELCEKNADGSSVSLPGKLRGRLEDGILVIETDTGRDVPKNISGAYKVKLSVGDNPLPFGQRIVLTDKASTSTDPYIVIDQSSLAPHLIARSRREGDRILSGRMHKSVKKLMCDKKIPKSDRDVLPVICDGNGILWIPGVAVRDGASSDNGNLKIIFYK